MKLSATLLLVSLISTACIAGNDSCFEFYRRDLLETWVVPKNSILCNITSPDQVEPYFYGMKSEKNTIAIMAKDFISSIEDNPVSEKYTDEFSVCIYRKDIKSAHFISLFKTDNADYIGQIQHRNIRGWADAHHKSRHFVGKKDIVRVGEYNLKILRVVVLFVELGMLVYSISFTRLKMNMVFSATWLICLSVLTGLLRIESIWLLLLLIAFSAVLGYTLAYCNWRYGNLNFATLSGFLSITYYWLGSTILQRTLFFVAFAFIAIVSSITVWLPGVSRKSRRDTVEVYVNLVAFWSSNYLFWSTFFSISLPELFMRVTDLPGDYMRGITGENVGLMYANIACLCVMLPIWIVTSLISRQRETLQSFSEDFVAYDPLERAPLSSEDQNKRNSLEYLNDRF